MVGAGGRRDILTAAPVERDDEASGNGDGARRARSSTGDGRATELSMVSRKGSTDMVMIDETEGGLSGRMRVRQGDLPRT